MHLPNQIQVTYWDVKLQVTFECRQIRIQQLEHKLDSLESLGFHEFLSLYKSPWNYYQDEQHINANNGLEYNGELMQVFKVFDRDGDGYIYNVASFIIAQQDNYINPTSSLGWMDTFVILIRGLINDVQTLEGNKYLKMEFIK